MLLTPAPRYVLFPMHIGISALRPKTPGTMNIECLRMALRTSLEAAERFSIGCGGDFEMWMPKASSSYGEFTTLRKGY